MNPTQNQFSLTGVSLKKQIPISILTCPDEAAERGRKARERVVSHYSWPIVRQRLVGVYRRLGVSL
jgi:glycosyltransferase involved in cell wall biosynthesis